MEQKLQNRYGRWGRALCFALALALAALLSLTALPLTGVYADETVPSMPRTPLNWDQRATLQLKLPEDLVTDEVDRDFLTKNLLVDVYKLADAVKVDGYDIYAFQLNKSLPASVQTEITSCLQQQPSWVVDVTDEATTFRYVPERVSGMIQDDGSMIELSQVAAKAIFEAPTAVPEINAKPFGEVQNVRFGLYLAMPHSELAQNQYQIKVPTKETENTLRVEYNPATLAIAPRNIYTFSPQLISVPSLGGIVTDTAANALTAWEYNVVATAKPEERTRYASLSVTKNLDRYNGPATFVFKVTATPVGGGDPVFEKLVNISFQSGNTLSQTSATIEDQIPAGTIVKVEELYTGVSYTFGSFNGERISNGGYVTVDPEDDALALRPSGMTVDAGWITPGNVQVIPWNNTNNEKVTIPAGVTLNIIANNLASDTPISGNGFVNHFDRNTDGSDWFGWNWKPIQIQPNPTQPQQ